MAGPWEEYQPKPEAKSEKPPWEEYANETGKAKGAPGAAQTFLEQTGNMASLGYLPQMQAAAKPAIYGVLNRLPDFMKRGLDIPTGVQVDPGSYVESRDKNIERMRAGEEENPNAALAGKIAGGVGGALATPMPALGMGKGILASAARGGVYGAGQAALSNPGDQQGVVDPIQAEERTSNAIHGAGIGALTGGIASGIEKGLGTLARSSDAAKEFAANKAFKGTGAMLKDWRASAAKDEIQDIGNFMLDRGIIKAGDTFENVAEKATALNKDAGKQLQALYAKGQNQILPVPMQNAIDKAGFNPSRDKDALMKVVTEKMGDNVRAKSAINKVSDYLDSLVEKYGNKTLDPATANKIKGFIDEEVNYARNPLTKEPAVEKAFHQARKFLNEKILKHVDEVGKAMGDPAAADALRQANKDFGYSRQIMNIAKDRSMRENANRMFGLTDTIVGTGAGAVAGGISDLASGGEHRGQSALTGAAFGLLGAGANKIGRTYGPGVQAASGRIAAPVLKYTAAPIGRAGQGLMQSINPDVLARLLAQSNSMK